jgi:hypothetical protein
MSLINDIKRQLRGATLTAEQALEIIAAVQQRVITPEPRHRFNGGGAIQGTIPTDQRDIPYILPGARPRPAQPDGVITGRVDYPSDAERFNQRGDYVHPAARPIPE